MMWKKHKLSEIGTVVGGATPSTTVERFYGGDIPWLTPKDLSNFQDRYIERGERNITQEGLDSCSAQLLPANSVLFSSRAPIGYVAIAKNPIATNQGFKSIIPNEKVDSLFLYYILKYNKDKIEAMGSGTTFKEVSGAVMKNVEISLPSLEEQRRIVGILGAIDDKIENNRRINTNLELQAQALFDRMFFENNKKERALLSLYADINPTRTLRQGINARYIEMANLPTKGSFPTDWTFKPFNGGVKFTNGDTIMARITPCLENGKTAYIDFLESEEVAFGSTEYIVISAKDGYCPALFYFLARNKEFVDYAVGHMNGSSGRQRVSGADIANFPMPNISIEESNDFAQVAMPVMDIIRRNSLENHTLAILRDTLLPKLMNGEIKIDE
ncbi:MAG: restriction endonuclease subunit S [Rikenellaceae bacterium]|nr:restriction endonuclease subunit S [Rikenellaceae bacterium]